MARPRSQLIALESTPYYHCISRCVRRAFLCGTDTDSGECYAHRKQWIVDKTQFLGDVFAINIAAYAVMSNHYHLVLHVDKARALQWSRDEVIQRWLMLYKGPVLARRYVQGDTLSNAELAMLDQLVATWRERLYSLSWFMGRLNEDIARRANKEDNCKGRFWEGRFVSRGLVDEVALLSCMAYVDLNPVRAGIAQDLLSSDFTSIQQRLQEVSLTTERVASKGKHQTTSAHTPIPDAMGEPLAKPRLMRFAEWLNDKPASEVIPFSLKDYITLVDNTRRAVCQVERGDIQSAPPNALAQLGLSKSQWLMLSLQVHKKSISMLNGLDILATMARKSRTQSHAA